MEESVGRESICTNLYTATVTIQLNHVLCAYQVISFRRYLLQYIDHGLAVKIVAISAQVRPDATVY